MLATNSRHSTVLFQNADSFCNIYEWVIRPFHRLYW